MGTTEETLKQLKREAFSGALGTATTETLNEYSAVLCHPLAYSVFNKYEFPQISETVRIHLLRAHIAKLQGHITDLDKKNTRLSWLVVVLTIVATASGVAQTTVAILPYAGIFPNSPPAAAQQMSVPSQSTPIHQAPPTSGQATKKAP